MFREFWCFNYTDLIYLNQQTEMNMNELYNTWTVPIFGLFEAIYLYLCSLNLYILNCMLINLN